MRLMATSLESQTMDMSSQVHLFRRMYSPHTEATKELAMLENPA